jgi:hypothetical protein
MTLFPCIRKMYNFNFEIYVCQCLNHTAGLCVLIDHISESTVLNNLWMAIHKLFNTVLTVVWFGSSRPPPTPTSVSSAGDTHEYWERETTCWRERAEGVGRGAESYYLKKAWSSINHSILSAIYPCIFHPVYLCWATKRTQLIIGQNYPYFLCHLHFCHPFTRIYTSAGNKFSDSLVYSCVHSQQGHNTCQAGPLGNVFYGLVQGGGLLTLFIAVREDSTVSTRMHVHFVQYMYLHTTV